jgi:hypothetical protein
MTLRASLQGLLLAAAALAASACDDSAASSADVTPVDAAPEVEDLSGRSVYRMKVRVGDELLALDRDLTGDSKYFAFGSTHIGPAVSFAVTDSVTFPRTMTVNFNFGIVVGSDTYPIQTTGAGTWPFSASPPDLGVFVRGLQYRGSTPGSTGEVIITAWSVETGEPVAGTFRGTLVAEGPSGATIDVEGSFHFTLPEKQ